MEWRLLKLNSTHLIGFFLIWLFRWTRAAHSAMLRMIWRLNRAHQDYCEWSAMSALSEKGGSGRYVLCIFNILHVLWKIVPYQQWTPSKKLNLSMLILKSTNNKSIKGQNYKKHCLGDLSNPWAMPSVLGNTPWPRRLGPHSRSHSDRPFQTGS